MQDLPPQAWHVTPNALHVSVKCQQHTVSITVCVCVCVEVLRVHGLPITPAPSANQNVKFNHSREKPEEWLPGLPHKVNQQSERLMDFERNQNKQWRTLIDDERYQLQLSEKVTFI